jgi:quercetin dioxygenase-like cupin family protein
MIFHVDLSTMPSQSQPYPSPRRIVTTHNAQGQATILSDNIVSATQAPHGPWLTPIWNSETLPPDVNVTADRSSVKTGLANNGTVFRYVDFPPMSKGAIHRTITLDYVVVLEGTIVLTLDDMSRTTMRKGDVCVQQGTMHGWDNEVDEWCRLLCVLIHAKNPVVEGRVLVAETHM